MRKPRIGKKSHMGIGMLIVTLVFVAIGTTCLIVGYKDSIVSWLSTTGIVILVLAALPLSILAYVFIQKKIES